MAWGSGAVQSVPSNCRVRYLSRNARTAAVFCVLLVLLALTVLSAFYFMLSSLNSDDVLKALASMQFQPKQSVTEVLRH